MTNKEVWQLDGLVAILRERRARYSQILRQIIFQNDSHAARGIKR